MKKETLIQVIIIILLTIILAGLIFITIKELNNRNYEMDVNNPMYQRNPMEEEVEKDTKKEDVDTGEMINAKTIKLDEYDGNVSKHIRI